MPPVFSSLDKTFVHVLATVARAKDSALLIRAKRVTQRRYENHVLISRIDYDRADLPRIFQPNVVPRFAAVDRFKDSGAVRRIAANRRFARADINHVVIGWRNRNRADRRNGCFVEKRSPICAAVSRLPHAARDRTEIICVRLTYDTFDRQRASSAKRTDLSPTHAIEQLFVDRSGRRWGRGGSGSNRSR